MQSTNNFDTINKLQSQLDDLLGKEELCWHERACVRWIQAGNMNTTYFHRRANGRYQRNLVKGLKKEDYQWVTEDLELGNIL